MRQVAELHYDIVRQIGVGAGANSIVFEAHDPAVGRTVAVKHIAKHHLTAQGVTKFFLEAEAMFAARHPNVVELIVGANLPDDVVLMMPLYSRGSLADRIKNAPLSARAVGRIAQEILLGVARVHIAGFIHLDIKPSNVLFSDRDNALLSDFGQSRMMDVNGVAEWPWMYPAALPPEYFINAAATPQSDVFQVALTLYRALNGDRFFTQQVTERLATYGGDITALAAAGATVIDPRRFMPHVPRGLRRVLRRALSFDPAARQSSAEEMAKQLAAVSVHLDWAAQPRTGGGCQWSVARPSGVTWLVELVPEGGGRYGVRTWTVNVSGK
jgi:serine/threonine protein kinase